MRLRLIALGIASLGLLVFVNGCSTDDGSGDGGGGEGANFTGGNASGGGNGTGSATGSGTGGEATCAKDACGVCDGDGSSCACDGGWCQAVVDEHNKIRAAVSAGDYHGQPKAEPALLPMVWDPLIAAKAQAYADSISDFSDGHSSSEYRTYASTNYEGYHGENMSIGGGNYAEPAYFVAEGWGASEAMNCQLASCGGHYTQIVWRESVAIGCGQKEGVTFSGGNVGTLTVCQYGPGGNINGRDPY